MRLLSAMALTKKTTNATGSVTTYQSPSCAFTMSTRLNDPALMMTGTSDSPSESS